MKCCSCSKGCELHIHTEKDGPILVTGGACHRGEDYALKVLALENLEGDKAVYRGHVKIRKAYMSYLMVTSDRAIPKEYFLTIDKNLENMTLDAPIEKYQVVYEETDHPEIRILASRGMKRRKG